MVYVCSFFEVRCHSRCGFTYHNDKTIRKAEEISQKTNKNTKGLKTLGISTFTDHSST